MSTKQTDLPKSDQADKKRPTSPDTKKTSSVHNSAGQTLDPSERKSNLEHMQEWNNEDLKKMGFREADRK